MPDLAGDLHRGLRDDLHRGTYYIVRLLKLGPVHSPHEDAPQAKSEAGRPKRPLSLPDERIEPAE